jgi:hypothetical protein
MTRRSLSWEIAAALAFKALALTVLYSAFFSKPHKTVVTPTEMAAFLVNKHSGLSH